MKRVWLIRHAESVANVGGRTTTPETIALTDIGEQQAKKLADEMSEEPDLIVTSGLLKKSL